MSHVTVKQPASKDDAIKNLDALRAACQRPEIGLEFKTGQKHFHNWATDHGGRLVGDYTESRPAGLKNITDVTKQCRHAMGIPVKSRTGKSHENYEIGVLEDPANPGQFLLAYDYYSSALDGKVSEKQGTLDKLMHFYKIEETKHLARARGFGVSEKKIAGTNKIKLSINTAGKVSR